jgi:hypothetical protein
MGVTAKDRKAVEFALSYLRKLAKKASIGMWPGHVARYILEEISFDDMLRVATDEASRVEPYDPSLKGLMARRETCVALFHDGIRIGPRVRKGSAWTGCANARRSTPGLSSPNAISPGMKERAARHS